MYLSRKFTSAPVWCVFGDTPSSSKALKHSSFRKELLEEKLVFFDVLPLNRKRHNTVIVIDEFNGGG